MPIINVFSNKLRLGKNANSDSLLLINGFISFSIQTISQGEGVLVRRLRRRIFYASITNQRRFNMDNYKEMYLILFNAMTEAIKILEDVQKKAEEIFINQ